MERRLILDAKLRDICDSVYFQPPETVKISYPCILYRLNDIQTIHADDINYRNKRAYTITYITRNPDEDLKDVMLNGFKYCSFDRWYSADNLNHFVYNLYF